MIEFDFPEATTIGAGHVGLSTAEVLEFRTTLSRSTLNIDREARTIDNVILATIGEARGHGVEIEQSFLDDMDRYVTKKMAGRVQCNMGHQWNALGFQFGYFTGTKIDGKQYKAKLTVYKAADKSPEMRGMGEWFFDLAEEDPKAVMCSIKFEPEHYYQYDEKGQKVIIPYSWWSGPQKAFEKKPAYVAFKRLISCDIVDEGALTDSLFSEGDQGAGKMLASIVSSPGFMQWYKVNHQHFPQLAEFYSQQDKFSFRNFFTSIFAKDMDPKESTTPAAPVAASATPAPAAPATPEAPAVDLAALQASITAMQEQITQLQATNTAQAAEITALKAAPAATPTGTKNEDPGRVDASASENLWDKNPINMRARSFQTAKKV